MLNASIILMMLLVWVIGLSPALSLADAKLPVRLEGGSVFYKPVETWKERRMRQMVPQSTDFSCGAAAMATILRYHFGCRVEEKEAIVGMFQHGDQEQIKKVGFSMLDMKRFCQSVQYSAQGYRAQDIQSLKGLKVPIITIVTTRKYTHFVVVRGVDDNFVYLSDPSWGNRKMRHDDFNEAWPQRVFLAIDGAKMGEPEGLYCEAGGMGAPKDQVTRAGRLLGHTFVMDPSLSMINTFQAPLFPNPFVRGSR